MTHFRIGQVYRYAKPKSPTPVEIDGLPNYFHIVHTAGRALPLLERGINPIAAVAGKEGMRVPAILIGSSPHKVGSLETPWQDIFDADAGFIRYSGDNKPNRKDPKTHLDPATSPGNACLLRELARHTSPESALRRGSTPIVFFRRVPYRRRTKGNVEFQGFGVLQRAERVTQFDPKTRQYFANYVFEFCVLSMAAEGELFDWKWIAARRDPSLSNRDGEALAPKAWRHWLKGGPGVLESVRRKVYAVSIVPTEAQVPTAGSSERHDLDAIYDFYNGRKGRFELLASRAVAALLRREHASYVEGWVTPVGSDHGVDFVGRVDLGHGFAKTQMVMLGQAKCEGPDTPTGGLHIARTVARLKRGWLGAYVTTSYFSDKVQREVLEDRYPILLVHGLDLARTVASLARDQGFANVLDYLRDVDAQYETSLRVARPEEVLFL